MMPLQIKKLSDLGASSPIFARLVVQTNELLGFCTIPKEPKDEILTLYLNEILPRVNECDTIARKMSTDVGAIIADLEANGPRTQAGGRVVDVPQVMKLREDCERYLYAAKLALREMAKVFKPFFGQEFIGAKYNRILAWSAATYGDEHPLTKMLRTDHDLWIHQLIDMRNAVEHPGTTRLEIRNFEFVDGQFTTPSWRLNDGQRSAIHLDMPAHVQNLLTFGEDLLVVSIETVGKFPGVGFAVIPESERNPTLPTRVRPVPLTRIQPQVG